VQLKNLDEAAKQYPFGVAGGSQQVITLPAGTSDVEGSKLWSPR